LIEICSASFRDAVNYFEPEWIIGIGEFPYRQAQKSLANSPIKIAKIEHPSPANPKANKGWDKLITAQLETAGIQIERISRHR
jgi:single-strand selective monofunctional uracil DNA glycosylase